VRYFFPSDRSGSPLRIRDHLALGGVIALILSLSCLALLYLAGAAFAQDPIVGQGTAAPVTDGPSTNAVNLYLVLLGGLTPLVGYVLNRFLSIPEEVKGLIHAGLAAFVGVLYTAASGGDFGLNDETLLAALTAMFAALFGHVGWKTAEINQRLNGTKSV
jgi:hypothetical protein